MGEEEQNDVPFPDSSVTLQELIDYILENGVSGVWIEAREPLSGMRIRVDVDVEILDGGPNANCH